MSKTDPDKKCYEVLLAEHARLRSLLGELTAILANRSAEISEVLRRLRELSELIDDHFKTEEDGECFTELVSQAPRVSDKVDELIAEHGEIRVDIAGLVELAAGCDGTTACWEKLQGDFSRFTQRLVKHEETENDLVQLVFTEDIGSKD